MVDWGGGTYGLRQRRIDVSILEGKRHASSKTPSPVEDIDGPEELDGTRAFFFVRDDLEKRVSSVKAKFDAHSSYLAYDTPC
jgi:hypothetical protein